MFRNVQDFLLRFEAKFTPFRDVLDVGSYNINGSVKDILSPASYVNFTGIDMRPGPGVDLVLNGHELDTLGYECFDLITCCETLEHDDMFWLTVANMRDALKHRGWMLVTVPGISFTKHDFPHDYYRFTEEAVAKMFEGYTDFHLEYYYDHNDLNKEKPNNSIFAYGRKP